MSAHTPGPWKVRTEKAWLQVENGQYVICNVGATPVPHREPHLSNARLIAAAPDLLEACKAGLLQMGLTRGHAAVLEAAIAKAEGK